ncbi:Plant protein of unknown function [Forsythia ovata]|uniref:Uncharacterized protein n=1 Tax=Forsythia ovata TaxID=205694 RepID=A0ABD1P3L1_9LAMI
MEGMTTVGTKDWLISIENYDDGTTKKSLIGRVPPMLREIESNKKCYDPLVVSIGPYHYGKPELQDLEKLKIRFAHQFYRACDNDQVSIQELYAKVAEVAGDARKCYEEDWTTKCLNNESFIRMMFLDGCFILQYMNILTGEKGVDQLQAVKSSNLLFVWRDLFLLENQIPLLLLKKVEASTPSSRLRAALHDLLLQDPSRLREKNQGTSITWEESPHLLDLMRAYLIGTSGPGIIENPIYSPSSYWVPNRSVIELVKSGIHFKASKTTNFTDVDFKSYFIYGNLMLPPILVDDTTKPLLLNLAAYEMSPHGPSEFRVTSYICLMDSLISRAEDVKELREKRIIVNNLGSDEQLARLFNEIAAYVVLDPLAYADFNYHIAKYHKYGLPVQKVCVRLSINDMSISAFTVAKASESPSLPVTSSMHSSLPVPALPVTVAGVQAYSRPRRARL